MLLLPLITVLNYGNDSIDKSPLSSYADKLKVRISFSDTTICPISQKMSYFSFGKQDISKTAPVFIAGHTINYSDDVLLVLENTFWYPENPVAISYGGTRIEGYLRNNLGLVWQDWFKGKNKNKNKKIYNNLTSSVNKENNIALMKLINCDDLYYIEIPNKRKVRCGDFTFNRLIRKFDHCYCVEIHKHGYNPIIILCFTRGANEIEHIIIIIGNNFQYID